MMNIRQLPETFFQDFFGLKLTAEQLAAVTAPLDGKPKLVIAGAGSGKTRVMALRAAWLVATEQVMPSEIIGLTFTRKAASELEDRLSRYLAALKKTSHNSGSQRFWPEAIPADSELPTVSTYNSFAVDVFQQRALLLGFENDAETMGEAESFRLARSVSLFPGTELTAELANTDLRSNSLVEATLRFSHELADNGVSNDAAIKFLTELREFLDEIPPEGKTENGRFVYFQEMVDRVSTNILVAKLADKYQDAKFQQGVLEYSDQVLLALRGMSLQPLESHFRAVLLDEYQDTSPMQAKLLSQAFSGRSVMAVGDPRQAIYGWRGASSANLTEFFADFGHTGPPDENYFELTTNWRSDRNIVAAANLISKGIDFKSISLHTATSASTNGALVSAPTAEPGRVWVSVCNDQSLETASVADWFTERFAENPNATAAILFRSRSSMPAFARALSQSDVPIAVFGIGGILSIPEVADLVSALRVVYQVDSGLYLMRLLAGPRWRVSPGDIAALSRYASFVAKNSTEFDLGSNFSLTEALDDLIFAKQEPRGMSKEGFSRLKEAAQHFRRMRTYMGLGLSETARLIMEELQIDIETIANSRVSNTDPLRNLNQFLKIIDDYENRTLRPSMSDFLDWLTFATEHERIDAPQVSGKQGVVQLLTVHAAKGLEWDLVAVPNLLVDDFPAKTRESKGWMNLGKLPFPLRQDSGGLPSWDFQGKSSQKELNQSFKDFQAAMAKHRLDEERRIAYVAFTRAARELLLTASFWSPSRNNPRTISPYLLEQLENPHTLHYGHQATEPSTENPLIETATVAQWPVAENSEQSERLRVATQLVLTTPPAEESELIGKLLSERIRIRNHESSLIPRRLSASALVALINDPKNFSKSVTRPMPSEFSSEAQLGTVVHAAIETFFLGDAEFDSVYSKGQSVEVEALLSKFGDSHFPTKTPEHIEHEMEFVLGPFLITCKVDVIFRSGTDFEIVDWKTGSEPSSPEDLAKRSLQLAIYRIAFSELYEIPLERIQAGFFFLQSGKYVIPDRLDNRESLLKKVAVALEELG